MSASSSGETLLPPNTLEGVRLAVSASTSPDLGRLGLLEAHFRLALGEIARAVMVLGGSLQYGGHLDPNGLTPFLLGEVKRYGRRDQPLSVLLAWSVHRRLSLRELRQAVSDLGLFGSVTCLALDGTRVDCASDRSEAPQDLPAQQVGRALTAMRETAVREAHGRIVMGGRRSGYQGAMPGVLEEALVTLTAGQPLYLAGGFGGVTLDLVRAVEARAAQWLPDGREPEVTNEGYRLGLERFTARVKGRGWAALVNGLDSEENSRLAATYRPSEVAALVSLGLGRLVQEGQLGGHQPGNAK